MNGSNWTGRAPRSLTAAFGPYTRDSVAPIPSKTGKWEYIGGVLLAIVMGLALFSTLCFGPGGLAQ